MTNEKQEQGQGEVSGVAGPAPVNSVEICTSELRIYGDDAHAQLQQKWQVHQGGKMRDEWRDVPSVPREEGEAAADDSEAQSHQTRRHGRSHHRAKQDEE